MKEKTIIQKFMEQVLVNYKKKNKKSKVKDFRDATFGFDDFNEQISGTTIKPIESKHSRGNIFKFYYQDGLYITHSFLQVVLDYNSWDDETYIHSITEVKPLEVTIYE